MLGSSNRVSRGGIHNKTTMLGGGGKIDVVDANPGAADHPEAAASGLEDLAADLGAAADNQGITQRDLGAELLGAEVIGAVDVGEILEQLETGLAELLRD
ncbi:putative D-3-phosphoglycerate dehydrogenase [Cocos nucifera]|nr:putative D-3-phosphoglycerate dehydrogenase [Cocos nucifera]